MFADKPIRCLGSKSDPRHLIGSAKSINQHIAPRGFPIWPAPPECRLQLQQNRKPPDPGYVWPCKGQKWIRKVKLHLQAWVWRHPGHRSFLLTNYCAMYASASKNPTFWKIQNKYFYWRNHTTLSTRKRLNTKSVLLICPFKKWQKI